MRTASKVNTDDVISVVSLSDDEFLSSIEEHEHDSYLKQLQRQLSDKTASTSLLPQQVLRVSSSSSDSSGGSDGTILHVCDVNT